MSLDLNGANMVLGEDYTVTIPPENAEQYPVKVDAKSLEKYIKEHPEDVMDLPLEENKKEAEKPSMEEK